MNKTVAVFGDLHFPFHDKAKLRKAYAVLSRIPKVDAVVQVGDLADFYSYGRWPRKLEVITPEQEYLMAKHHAAAFWQKIQSLHPAASCYQLIGNHDERPLKQILDKPEFHHIAKRALREFFTFEGVHTQPSERDELSLYGILFMHGFRSKIGDHVRHNRRNTCTGHSHHGGVVFERIGDETFWELNAGFLGDASTVPLSYTRQRQVSKWTHGIGIIDPLGPRFIPL